MIDRHQRWAFAGNFDRASIEGEARIVAKTVARGARPSLNGAAAMRLLTLVTGCSIMWGQASCLARGPNVLLIVTDDPRPDTISALGHTPIRTPVLDRLARQGTSFTQAISANPICTPSRAEILTGASGMRNGVLDFGGKIAADMALLGTTLGDAGYETCYVGKWHNDGRPGDRGYQRCEGLYAGGGGRFELDYPLDCHGRPVTGYRGWLFQANDRQLFPDQGVGLTPDISAAFADAAIRFLQTRSNRPFLLHVNFTAPHDPLLMPPGCDRLYDWQAMEVPANFAARHPFDHGNLRGRDEQLLPWPRTRDDVRKDLAVYYAVISDLDAQVGRILAALDQLHGQRETVVIFTSDHGLAMGSHGLRGKQNMYEHTIRVPLVLRGPGIPVDTRREALCYLRDLFPTICDLCGVPVPESVDGRSLVEIVRGEQKSVRDALFGYFRDKQRMVRTDRWKLIWYPHLDRWQLFDLKADPHEMQDLSQSPRHAKTLTALRKRLQAFQQEMGDPLCDEQDAPPPR